MTVYMDAPLKVNCTKSSTLTQKSKVTSCYKNALLSFLEINFSFFVRTFWKDYINSNTKSPLC